MKKECLKRLSVLLIVTGMLCSFSMTALAEEATPLEAASLEMDDENDRMQVVNLSETGLKREDRLKKTEILMLKINHWAVHTSWSK